MGIDILLSVSLVTMSLMVPLNSLILANPDEAVCLECLLTVYAVTTLGLTGWLFVCRTWWSEKAYRYSLNSFTVVSLFFFLNTIQSTTIPKFWRTPYTIFCILIFVVLVWSFVRTNKPVARLLLTFVLLLSAFELVNVGRIIFRNIDWVSPARVVAASQGTASTKASPHIFVVVFDELSLNHISKDATLDPVVVHNLSAFSQSATWYRNAVTPYAATDYAIPAMLTGRNDAGTFRQAFRGGTVEPHLFQVAARTHEVYIRGYYMEYCRVFQAYLKGCESMVQGFADYRDLFRTWWDFAVPGEIRRTKLGQRTRQAVAGYRDPSPSLTEALQLGQDFNRPTFVFIHVGLPHEPYMFHPNGEVRKDIIDFGPKSQLTQDELLSLREMYVEQVKYTDHLFGAFLADLKALEVFDSSVVVVTSDHGVSFDEAHQWRHQEWVEIDEIARVPFIVKMPGQQTGRIDDRPIKNMDLYSILLDILQ